MEREFDKAALVPENVTKATLDGVRNPILHAIEAFDEKTKAKLLNKIETMVQEEVIGLDENEIGTFEFRWANGCGRSKGDLYLVEVFHGYHSMGPSIENQNVFELIGEGYFQMKQFAASELALYLNTHEKIIRYYTVMECLDMVDAGLFTKEEDCSRLLMIRTRKMISNDVGIIHTTTCPLMYLRDGFFIAEL